MAARSVELVPKEQYGGESEGIDSAEVQSHCNRSIILAQVTVHVWSVSELKGFYQDAVYSKLKGADGSIDLFQFIVCDAVGWKDVDDVT